MERMYEAYKDSPRVLEVLKRIEKSANERKMKEVRDAFDRSDDRFRYDRDQAEAQREMSKDGE